MTSGARLTILTALTLLTLPARGADTLWGHWRPVTGNNVAPAGDYPLSWSPEKNVAWKIDLPDRGNSTPVVMGDKIYVTQALTEGNKRGIMCFSTADGKKLWEQFVNVDAAGKTHETNPFCSPSPATADNIVVAWLGNAGVFAWTLEGKLLWKKDLGPVVHRLGYGSSPVIHNKTVYLNFGPGNRSFLVALKLEDGEERWRIPIKVKNNRYEGGGSAGSYATPVIAPIADDTYELITTFPNIVLSINPDTGKENWRATGLDDNMRASPSVSGDLVLALGGYKFESIAVRRGGQGDVTQSHRLWQLDKYYKAIGTPLIVGEHYYRVRRNFLHCHELKTGSEVWKHRFSMTTAWSSPTQVGNHIYLVDKAGITTVFKHNPKTFEPVSTNETNGMETNASLHFANDAVYMRSYKQLWKFIKK